MNIYLVVEECWGIDWERRDNLEVFTTKEKAQQYIDNKEQEELSKDVKGRKFWIEEFILK